MINRTYENLRNIQTQSLTSQDSQISQSPLSEWGILLGYKSNIKNMVLHQKQKYTFGRGINCDYLFNEKCFNNCKSFVQCSIVHFNISKNKHANFVYITDVSKNGTYLNRKKIGNSENVTINHNDVISINSTDNVCKILENLFLNMVNNALWVFFTYIDIKSSMTKLPIPFKFKHQYVFIKDIGRGSFGNIKLLFDLKNNAKIVTKIIPIRCYLINQTQKTDNCQSILNEIKIIKSMNHPLIVKYIDAIKKINSEFWILMEYVPGGDLFDKIESHGPFNESFAYPIFYQILVAVEFIHENGVTHRDLKPENILLNFINNTFYVKIGDFGFSKVTKSKNLKSIVGTDIYIAPEILKIENGTYDQTFYTNSIDIWSCGILFYICMTKKSPFYQNYKSLLVNVPGIDKIINFKLLQKFPDIKMLVKQMCDIDPLKRIPISLAKESKIFNVYIFVTKIYILFRKKLRKLPKIMVPKLDSVHSLRSKKFFLILTLLLILCIIYIRHLQIKYLKERFTYKFSEIINEAKVVVISKSYCLYSQKAKNAFEKLIHEGILDEQDYKVHDIEYDPHMNEIQNILKDLTGSRTVPAIFLNSKYIGGGSDIESLYKTKNLHSIVQGK
ncbi:CHK2 checkpoint protein [Intoshia linei]|uniref:non-specific serine/threonine protein kinase n=1 Tax=Intoshia linei TaxID=1819745 RepID=A0A177B736_9BILA|nr:CHK2 checkpoint protein [Intoshia linei]